MFCKEVTFMVCKLFWWVFKYLNMPLTRWRRGTNKPFGAAPGWFMMDSWISRGVNYLTASRGKLCPCPLSQRVPSLAWADEFGKVESGVESVQLDSDPDSLSVHNISSAFISVAAPKCWVSDFYCFLLAFTDLKFLPDDITDICMTNRIYLVSNDAELQTLSCTKVMLLFRRWSNKLRWLIETLRMTRCDVSDCSKHPALSHYVNKTKVRNNRTLQRVAD